MLIEKKVSGSKVLPLTKITKREALLELEVQLHNVSEKVASHPSKQQTLQILLNALDKCNKVRLWAKDQNPFIASNGKAYRF